MTDCWSFETSILGLGQSDYYCKLINDGCLQARLRGHSLKVLMDTLKDVTACINNCDDDRCNSVGNTHDKKKWFYVFGFSIIFNNFVFRVLK